MLAYGTRPGVANFEHGIEIIIFVRRIQWLLVFISLGSCLGLLALVIANTTSVWWLTGLSVVLSLFCVRFAPGYARRGAVLDMPTLVNAAHASAPNPDDWVVGLHFEGEPYAFPYRALYETPIVAVTDYSKRLLLVWSAHANHALAVNITRDLRPRALEIVSTPADGLLIFERRYGQFISSVTGRTMSGGEPIGFRARVPVTKTTWSSWRALYPTTRVMVPTRRSTRASSKPLAPTSRSGPQHRRTIAIVESATPIAIAEDRVINQPLNLLAGETRILVLRDPRTGSIRAFERRVAHDLFPQFSRRAITQQRRAPELIDSDTQSLWTFDGKAVDGPLKGEQLRPIPVEDGLYWGVMKFWYPKLTLIK